MCQKIRAVVFAYLLPVIFLIISACGAGGGSTTTADAIPHAITINGTTLRWDPPTKYNNDMPLTVAGYKVYYGTTSGPPYNGSNSPIIINKSTTTTVFPSLITGSSATYHFAVTTFDASGVESDYSNEAVKFIKVP